MKKIFAIILSFISLASFGQQKITIAGSNPRTLFSANMGGSYNSTTGLFGTDSTVAVSISLAGLEGATNLQYTRLYYMTDSGRQGYFRHTANTPSADSGVNFHDGLGNNWKRIYTGWADGTWFGLVGDSATDNTVAFQAFANFSGSLKYLPSPAKAYLVRQNIYWNNSNYDFEGADKLATLIVQPIGNSYTGGGRYRSVFILGNIKTNGGVHNVIFGNMHIVNQDTVTKIGANYVQPVCIMAIQDTAFSHLTGSADSNLVFHDMTLEGTNSNTSGIFLDAYRNNYGGILKNWRVDKVDFINSGFGVGNSVTTGDTHLDQGYLGYCRFYLCHTFGSSISGLGTNILVEHNLIDSCTGIGLEMAGPSYSTTQYNDFYRCTQSYSSGNALVPWSFNSLGIATPGVGNKLLYNTVHDSVYNGAYIYKQDKFTSIGNYEKFVNTVNGGQLVTTFGSVTNATSTNDTWVFPGGESAVSAFNIVNYGGTGPASGNGICHDMTFVNPTIIGAATGVSLIHVADSGYNIHFIGGSFGTHPTTIVNTDGTITNFSIQGYDAANTKSFNYGTPTSINAVGLITQENDSAQRQLAIGSGLAVVSGALTATGGGGGGNTNSNVGSGYRFALPGTNNIKTLFVSGGTLDSTTNANALTLTITGTGSPAGSTTQLQYNNAGSFGASSNLTWSGTTLSVTGTVSGTTLSATSGMTSNAYKGLSGTTFIGSGNTSFGVNFQRGGTTDAGLYASTGNFFIAPNGATNADKSISFQLYGSMSINTSIQSGASYTILATDYAVIFTGTSAATWTFPTGAAGRILYLVNQGTATITLGTAVTTANGTTTTSLAAGSNYQIIYDATNSVWRKIN